jgi:hypothetical protein
MHYFRKVNREGKHFEKISKEFFLIDEGQDNVEYTAWDDQLVHSR